MSRWMTPDPLAGDLTNPQSLNRYAYVMNNPTTLTDPLGLDSIPPHPVGCYTSSCAWEHYGWLPYQGYTNAGALACFQDGVAGNCDNILMSLQNGSVAQCPENVCSGFGTNVKTGQTIYAWFQPTADGQNNWYTFTSHANWENYLNSQFPNQISGQYNRLSSNLQSLFGDVASADPNNPDVIGGHANFQFTCDDWTVCGPGRYDFGVHVEEDPFGNLLVHNDNASPWTSPFSISNFNPFNLAKHGAVDLIYGSIFVNVFPH